MTKEVFNNHIKISTKEIILGYKNILDIDVSHTFQGLEYIYVHQNPITGHKFFSPENIAGNDEFYQELQKFDWYYQKDKWEFEVARKHIKCGNLLEIGCGMGFFLDDLVNIENLEVLGTEYNKQSIEFCKSKGLNVDKFELSEFGTSNFDYIVSFQVLEHLSNWEFFFKEAYRTLKKDGKLIVGVPNSDSFIFHPFSDSYFKNGSLLLNLPPHHMGWWNIKSLIKAGEYFGFKLIYYEIEIPKFFRFKLMAENIEIFLRIKGLEYIIRKYLIPIFKFFLKGETIVAVFEKKE